ncbi:DNA-directed RNA polymerase subunit alpha [Rhodotorula sp. JG-1b]|nr:DNA-directed RNA polymerase subunit alpha [Rhodotorula sp. JG-1b]
MQRSQTPRGAFDAASAADSLQKLFQAELDAVHRAGNAQGPKPELYKPAQAPAGPWGTATTGRPAPKAGAMANGQDFLATLSAGLEKAKGAAASMKTK